MNVKKIAVIPEISNSSFFAYNPSDGNIFVYRHFSNEKKPITYHTELSVYINLKQHFVTKFEGVAVLEKFMHNDSFLVTTQKPTLMFMNCKTLEIKEYDFIEQITCKIEDRLLISGRVLKDFKNETELKLDGGISLNPYYHTCIPKYFICGPVRFKNKWEIDMTYISACSTKTGKELWSYDISKRFPEKFKDLQGREHEVKVSRFMGDEPDKIWLLLWNGAVLVLEGQTGKELALIGRPLSNEFNVPFEESVKHQIGNAGYLDERNKKVISLIDCYYHEINTVTYELTFLDLKEEFEKHSVSSIGTLSFDDNYIYFYNKKFMGSNKCCKIGILNRKTFKIDWSYDFAAQEGSFPMSLEIYNNKIFVVDGSQRLHIFEKENE